MTSLNEILGDSSRFDQKRIALISPEKNQVTYDELWKRVRGLGAELRAAGLGEGQLIGHCMPKSDTSAIALCGILNIDAAYVPVDVESPAIRNVTIFSDCLVSSILITSDRAEEYAEELSCDVEVIPCNETGLTLLKCNWGQAEHPKRAGNLAMILYTSGSSGAPKGVQITHGNALTFIQWCIATLAPGPPGVCASIAPFHFDLSLFDLYVSFIRGESVLLLDHRTCQNPLMLGSYLAKYDVSQCYTTPTMLKMLLNHGRLHKYDFSSLQRVLFAGEVFPIEPLRSLQRLWPGVQFFNLYGPTETNVVTHYCIPKHIEPDRTNAFPIGLPCGHASCMIAIDDRFLEPAPNLEGELLISGPSVTPGYLGSSADNGGGPFMEIGGCRYYRTGDVVRVLDDGNMEFRGRKDRTVKRRGYRIALEEIEHTLCSHPVAHEIAVTCEISNDEPEINAYFVSLERETAPTSSELRRFCSSKLPGYFIPDRFILTVELPKTSTGKIDYHRLALK